MVSKVVMTFVFNIFIFSELLLLSVKARAWIRIGYWHSSNSSIPISDINSSLFTYLVCAFASVNSTSYQISLSPSDEEKFSKFTATVKQKNPSVATLLSIGGDRTSNSIFSSTLSNPSHRKSFIESSIKIARIYGFKGLDLSWPTVNTSSDMYNMGILFEEWRAAVDLEARSLNSSQSQLILTTSVTYSPRKTTGSFPVEAMQQYLNWVHVITAEYFRPRPGQKNITKPHAALYDPTSVRNTDYGITRWIDAGLSADKLVFCLPFNGYAWTLVNPEDNGIGAHAIGPALAEDGSLPYKFIKNYIQQNQDNNVHIIYNATYVVNYCSIGTIWIGFDDVEAVRAKISYAKEKKLLGYYVWEVSFDDNWVLSQAAAEEDNTSGLKKWRILEIVLPAAAAGTLLLGCLLYYWWMKKRKLQGKFLGAAEDSKERANSQAPDSGDFNRNTPNLRVYSLADIEAATDTFSIQNKLGEGGYGPVYKGILQNGEEIAVKKLSKTSTQGFEEFKNEVMLTAKLQHVNLVRVLGFCIDREEHMLIYEYMPKKSLDCYIFDPIRRHILDWKKRVHIIEGITQGLLYLQEYSRLTIIHRDLKASNVLLDEDMKPKISDFGMARIFVKEDLEANTERIVGTIGYIPPEYARRGIYSPKSDVYSFGVLLLQIISGKRISLLYGLHENLGLLEYAYELWKEGKDKELMDPLLDDTDSSCKLIRCLQIALLCVQEKPFDRPSMLEVSLMLKNETICINTPKKPAFSNQGDEDQRNKSLMKSEVCSVNDVTICSVNDLTISEQVAR